MALPASSTSLHAAQGTTAGSPCSRERGLASPWGAGWLLLGISCHVTATPKFTIKVLLFLFHTIKQEMFYEFSSSGKTLILGNARCVF